LSKDKHILVTGGTGFVGSYLLRYLLSEGYSNIRAIRRPQSSMDLVSDINSKIKWIDCDLLDVIGLEDAFKGVQQVYHSAAIVSFLPSERKYMKQVNVEGTANVVNMSLFHGIEKLIHVSSIAAIGRRKQEVTISESSKWERSPFNSKYAISKRLAELEVWRGVAEGLSANVINPSMILGAGRWEDGPQKFFKVVWDEIAYYPRGTNGFVDVRDVVKMMVLLMEKDISGERVIASSASLSYQELMTHIARHLGKKPPAKALSPLLTHLFWRLEWLKSKLTGQEPTVTKETALHTSRTFYYDHTKSKELLHFDYMPIEKTIADIAPAFLEASRHNFESRLFQFA
jgi:dihydroflavonol-4-reductase